MSVYTQRIWGILAEQQRGGHRVGIDDVAMRHVIQELRHCIEAPGIEQLTYISIKGKTSFWSLNVS